MAARSSRLPSDDLPPAPGAARLLRLVDPDTGAQPASYGLPRIRPSRRLLCEEEGTPRYWVDSLASYAGVLAGTHTPLMQRVPRPRKDGNVAQSSSAAHPLPTGQQTPFPQQAKSGAQVARKGTQLPPSQRVPSHGSSLAATQSASARQLPPPSTGQQEPLS